MNWGEFKARIDREVKDDDLIWLVNLGGTGVSNVYDVPVDRVHIAWWTIDGVKGAVIHELRSFKAED